MGADVIVEYHGDAMAHTYGFDYADIAAMCPALIWRSVSGLGHRAGGGAIDTTLQPSMGMSAPMRDESGPSGGSL
jgi:crotonobetainyl-CoA:carnitine CoA-transferase CaiB-like acyl-CoA transferase